MHCFIHSMVFITVICNVCSHRCIPQLLMLYFYIMEQVSRKFSFLMLGAHEPSFLPPIPSPLLPLFSSPFSPPSTSSLPLLFSPLLSPSLPLLPLSSPPSLSLSPFLPPLSPSLLPPFLPFSPSLPPSLFLTLPYSRNVSLPYHYQMTVYIQDDSPISDFLPLSSDSC